MKVTVVANVEQQKEILLKKTNADVLFVFINSLSDINAQDDSDIFLLLTEEIVDKEFEAFKGKPVFINLVIETLEQKKMPSNFSRINGWPGFLQRQVWEVASNDTTLASKEFKDLGWGVIFVKDEPGLIAARVISMIINEAFFALKENVSTMEEIDLAMKLGTNYPYGPFEWLDKIGLQKIYDLLSDLSAMDKRYSVCFLLQKKYLELSSQ